MQNCNEDNIAIGERIREIRKSLNMNRDKFSEIIDISEVFLGQIERGERSLSLKTLKKIVSYSGYSTDYILFGDNSSNSKIKKIDRILYKCSDDNLDYFYKILYVSYSYFKEFPLKR